MKMRLVLVPLCLTAFAAACSQPAPEPAPSSSSRKYLLERVDDVAVVQLYADGFEGLPLKDKTLIWHLSEAAIAGRDIYADQLSSSVLEMREILEGILTHAGGVNPQSLNEIRRYTKIFWINSGPYNNLTAKKFVLNLPAQAFAEAVQAAAVSGATFPLAAGETLPQLIARLGPMFLDPSVKPSVTAKNPPAGQDILTASSHSLYKDVSLKDLQGFKERYGLNSRLVKASTGLVEEVYRTGGRYDAQIREVVGHLEAARAFAPAPTVKALDALI